MLQRTCATLSVTGSLLCLSLALARHRACNLKARGAQPSRTERWKVFKGGTRSWRFQSEFSHLRLFSKKLYLFIPKHSLFSVSYTHPFLLFLGSPGVRKKG